MALNSRDAAAENGRELDGGRFSDSLPDDAADHLIPRRRQIPDMQKESFPSSLNRSRRFALEVAAVGAAAGSVTTQTSDRSNATVACRQSSAQRSRIDGRTAAAAQPDGRWWKGGSDAVRKAGAGRECRWCRSDAPTEPPVADRL